MVTSASDPHLGMDGCFAHVNFCPPTHKHVLVMKGGSRVRKATRYTVNGDGLGAQRKDFLMLYNFFIQLWVISYSDVFFYVFQIAEI